jgi:hypothetical protein
MERLRGLTKALAHVLPPSVKERFRNTVLRRRQALRAFLQGFKPTIWIYEGIEASTQTPMVLAYVGEDAPYREYVAEMAFTEMPPPSVQGRAWIWSVCRRPRSLNPDAHLAVAEIYPAIARFLPYRPGFHFPRWVETALDLSPPFEAVFPKRASRDMRRHINKQGYTYSVTRNQEAFTDFYDHMYRPYIEAAFGDAAYLLSRHWFAELTKKSELLQVWAGQTNVSSLLIEYAQKKVLMGYVGIRDGDSGLVKEGALAALTYFAADYLKKKGFAGVSMGPSKSFLNDGPLRSKVLKGAQIVDKAFTPDENAILWLLRDTKPLRGFLKTHPFVYYPKNRRRHAALFQEAAGALNTETVESVLGPYSHFEGIDRWDMFVFLGPAGAACLPSGMTRLPSGQTVTVSPAEKCFPEG